jgi:hypothetical protein
LPEEVHRCAKLPSVLVPSATFLLVVMPTVALGALAGRFPKLLVLVVVPIPIAWIAYQQSYKGPGDDVTGPLVTLGAALVMGIFLAAAAISWLVLRLWRRMRSGNGLDLQ